MKYLQLNILVIITCCLSFNSCVKEEYHNVPVEYYPLYKEGDTLIYRSGNNYDTFCFTSKDIIDHETDKKYHYQELRYNILNKNYPELNYPYTCTIILNTLGVSISWLHFYNQFNYYENPTIQNININNILYNNVYELNNTSTDSSYNYVKKIFFNYKFWVVRYIRTDSTIWDLIQH